MIEKESQLINDNCISYQMHSGCPVSGSDGPRSREPAGPTVRYRQGYPHHVFSCRWAGQCPLCYGFCCLPWHQLL